MLFFLLALEQIDDIHVVPPGLGADRIRSGRRSPVRLCTFIATPCGDRCVVALAQHRGDGSSLEVGGTRVQRCLETAAGTVGKGFLTKRFGRADDAGHQARRRLDDRHGRDLAAAQHVVADRQLLADLVARTLVDTLVAAADEQDRRAPPASSRATPWSNRRPCGESRMQRMSGLGLAQRAHRADHRLGLEAPSPRRRRRARRPPGDAGLRCARAGRARAARRRRPRARARRHRLPSGPGNTSGKIVST